MAHSMDSILSDESSVPAQTAPESDSPSESVAEPEATEGAGAMPEPAAAKASTKATATVDDDEDAEEHDPVDESLDGLKKALTAVRGDKRKMRKQWREAERKAEEHARRLAQLEGQLTAYQRIGVRPQEQAQPEIPKPDFYGNPEEYIAHREKQLRDEFRQAQFRRDADRSERRMLREHPDYNEAKAAFTQAVQSNPSLWAKVVEDPEPAEVVYEEGKRLLRGGKSEREAQLEAELAELKAKAAGGATSTATPNPRPSITKSIASARGAGASGHNAWSGPRDIKELFQS